MSTVASGYEFKTRLRQGSKSEPNTDMEDKVKKQKLILCTDAVRSLFKSPQSQFPARVHLSFFLTTNSQEMLTDIRNILKIYNSIYATNSGLFCL